MTRKTAVLAIALIASAAAVSLLTVGRDAAGDQLRDIDGRDHGSLTEARADWSVLLFLGTTCPVSLEYAPEIIRICTDFESRGTACYLVFPEPGLSASALKEHLRAYGHTAPAILDARHGLVERAGATVTPEAAVFSRTGELMYRGRIDDRHVDFGRSRVEARKRDLRDALDALASGRTVEQSRTEAVGCFIEPLQE